MALSDADLDAAWTKARSKNGPQWVPYFEALRAVAALVRKDDEALIRQLTDLVQAQHDYIMALPVDVVASLPAMPGFDGDWADEIKAAGRARLEGKPITSADL